MSLQPFPIFAQKGGLKTDVRPVFLPDTFFQKLDNAYCWRERIKKREGLKFLGRLERSLTNQDLGTTTALATSITFSNIFTTLSLSTNEPNAELVPGSLVITIAAPDTATFTDNGDGTFTVTGLGVASGSYVNYATGLVVLQFSAPLTGGANITADLNYYPSLPAMGILTRDLSNINFEQSIFFDEIYAYVWASNVFVEFIPGTTWLSTDSDFFWGFNYRGAADNIRLLFVTNFVNTAANPIRYTDGNTWTDFLPIIADNPPSAAQSLIYTARIIVAYYGRLLLLNTLEGTTAGGNAGAVNFFNRCRFSQLGDPTAADAFRSDQFGKGGFLDAPTNEAIISAQFIRNTLVVTFERTTWQLRYVGEYGFPFVWERISADFGSESTFSTVLFDNQMLAVGDVAIIAANGNSVERIDIDIPDLVFDFKNSNNGVKRIFGIRNYQKEIVYWNYPDSQSKDDIVFPNRVLIYNYRNNTWATFRDNVTCFGNFQLDTGLNWDSQTVTWDSETVLWDDAQNQSEFPLIVSGNQQGFISLYQEDENSQIGFSIQEEPSLSITGINLTVSPIQITVVNHNLTDGEVIYIHGMMFIANSTKLPIATDLNDKFYEVRVKDDNTLYLSSFNFTTNSYSITFPFTPVSTDYIYIGGGTVTLIPKLDVITKDINVYQNKSMQTKLSRLDFLMQPTNGSSFSINLNLNSASVVRGNVLVGNKDLSTNITAPFYTPGTFYLWFRFYATLAAQYFNVEMTYSDALMNTLSTHQNTWIMYAMTAWCRPGGKNVF